MPSRSSHSKSRNGCVKCKRAHIKCDQSWPSCSKCTKSKKTCVYMLGPSDRSTTSLGPHVPSPTPNPLSSCTLPAPSHPSTLISGFQPGDLELMHHYTTSTYVTLAGHDAMMQEAWQVQVPVEAYANPYLMHSLLALAALHRNSLPKAGKSECSLASAVSHYNSALASSKPVLSNVNADNCTSLFGFSAIIAIIAYALPLHPPGHQLDDPISELLQISTLVRGSSSIVEAELGQVKAGSLAALLPNDFLAHECELPSDARDALGLLQDCADACPDDDSGAKAIYKHTIERLELCFRNTVLDPENRMVVMSWLVMVQDAYLSLLHARASIAQVCLAYFAVLLHGLRKIWWCGDWGKRLVTWVECEGVGEWQGLLDWPKKKIGLVPSPRI